MLCSNETAAPRADMLSAPSAVAAEPQRARTYAAGRSAATRPLLPLASLRSARQSRALQLSWVGLVRR